MNMCDFIASLDPLAVSPDFLAVLPDPFAGPTDPRDDLLEPMGFPPFPLTAPEIFLMTF